MKTATGILTSLIALAVLCASACAAPQYFGTMRGDSACVNFGYRLMPLGDQNNDGYDDVLIYDCGPDAGLFFGGTTLPDHDRLRISGCLSLLRVFGDVNGDGFDDLALSHSSHKLGLYYGGPVLDSILDLRFGLDTLWGLGNTCLGHDINANGTDELISWSTKQWSVLLYEMGASVDSVHDMLITPANLPFTQCSFGHRMIAGDFNGDGKRDLIVSYRPVETSGTKGALYCYWGGPTFDTIPELIIRRLNPWAEGQENFGDVLEYLGDFNGDGYDDFLAGSSGSSYDTCHYIYFGGPTLDTIPEIVIYDRMRNARWAGDINHDGYNDLIVGYPFPSASSGKVYLYLGGPGADGRADWVLQNSELPGYHYEFGKDVSGIGDFNGDGIDDFAFSATGRSNTGEVYFFTGWDDGQTVADDDGATVPGDYRLSQNYPNPFNATTTIEFTVPRRGWVELSVYNVLGMKVATILSEERIAGTYRVTWDGKNGQGHDVSSGVYLYRLTSGEFSTAKKMLLLK